MNRLLGISTLCALTACGELTGTSPAIEFDAAASSQFCRPISEATFNARQKTMKMGFFGTQAGKKFSTFSTVSEADEDIKPTYFKRNLATVNKDTYIHYMPKNSEPVFLRVVKPATMKVDDTSIICGPRAAEPAS